MPDQHVFKFVRPDDEVLEVHLDGQHVVTANHDEDGWSGMRKVEETIKEIAKIIGARVEEE